MELYSATFSWGEHSVVTYINTEDTAVTILTDSFDNAITNLGSFLPTIVEEIFSDKICYYCLCKGKNEERVVRTLKEKFLDPENWVISHKTLLHNCVCIKDGFLCQE
jgi:hypothetical protein